MPHKKPLLAMSDKDKARFYSKIRPGAPDECHEWTASCSIGGYGRFGTAPGTMVYAHRVAYMLHHHVELPPRDPYSKTFVLHTCDNPKCCNPAHLYLGTAQNNTNDMKRRGRSLIGEASGSAILSEDDVRSIRAFYAVKANRGALGREYLSQRYGISFNSIGDITGGRSWKHVV